MTKKSLFRFKSEETFTSSRLIVLWKSEESDLEEKAISFLLEKLEGKEFCSLDPSAFYTLEGVQVKNNVASIPSSRFYRCAHDIVILISDTPQQEWNVFLSTILELAEKHFKVEEIFTIGVMITLTAHTTPRDLYGISNSVEMRDTLLNNGINRGMNFESQPGQRPTLSSYLLWEANRRHMKGASLWIGVPFYLAGVGDPKARKRVLDFFNRRYSLNLNFAGINEEIGRQSIKLMELQTESPEADALIKRLETNITLNEDETVSLVKRVEEHLAEE